MDYILHIGIIFSIYAILGVSLNLVVGYTGLVSAAHAGFYALGAYAVALGTTKYGLNFFLATLLGVAITAAFSLAIGVVLSRYKDDYYVLVSLGFTGIIYALLLNLEPLTRGSYGVASIKRPEIFGTPLLATASYLVLALSFLAITIAVTRWITVTSFGRVLRAIREDEQAIQIFGYHTFSYKLIAFVISACLASTAGALFAPYIAYVHPSTFTIHESIFILAIVVLGGLASIRGSLLGAAILTLLPEALRFLGLPGDVAAQIRQIVYGSLITIIMLYRPQGFLGTFRL